MIERVTEFNFVDYSLTFCGDLQIDLQEWRGMSITFSSDANQFDMKVALLAQKGDAHMKRSLMLIGNYEIKETYLGVVPTLFDPKKIPVKWNRLDYLQCSVFRSGACASRLDSRDQQKLSRKTEMRVIFYYSFFKCTLKNVGGAVASWLVHSSVDWLAQAGDTLLGQDTLFSLCHSPTRCINGYWRI